MSDIHADCNSGHLLFLSSTPLLCLPPLLSFCMSPPFAFKWLLMPIPVLPPPTSLALSVPLPVCLPICPYVFLPICPSALLPVCFVAVSVCLPVCLPASQLVLSDLGLLDGKAAREAAAYTSNHMKVADTEGVGALDMEAFSRWGVG